MNPNANDNIEQLKEDVRLEAEQPESHAKKVVDSHVNENQIEPHKLSYQDFKKIVPNAQKYSRKELRKSHRDYLKYAKKKRNE
ncbi:MAG: hypothetical protein ABJG33_00110 [Balneola sp.]